VKKGISVVIPAYNHGAFLAEAIESVRRQTVPPSQILIVDDGSEDVIEPLVQSFEDCQYSRIAHAGAASARNRAIELADQDFLAFLDADDLWVPQKLELQMDLMERQADLDMVFGRVEEFYSSEMSVAERMANLRTNSPGFVFGTMLIRRESFRRVGKLDESLRVGEFIDWYGRANDRGLTGTMPDQIVLRRRVHQSNSMRRDRGAAADYARVFKNVLDRRRAEIAAALA
jgi:glycosyltransferase involved in cell wall biosynthesis